MDAIERRVAWIAISVAIVIGFAVSGGFSIGISDNFGGWELAFYIFVLVALGGAAGLLVVALVPAPIRPLLPEQRELLAFYAFALWALAIIVGLGLGIHAAVEAHRHPNSFG